MSGHGELGPISVQGFELDDADPTKLRQALNDLGVGQSVIGGDLLHRHLTQEQRIQPG